MIPLRIKADAPQAGGAFIVRVRASEPGRTGSPLTDDDAVIERNDGGCLHLRTAAGRLSLFEVALREVDGDVLLVVPERHVAHRLIRAKSQHNTFLVTERCDQLCVMCSQPPKKHHVDLFPLFQQAALLAPAGAIIGISGGEPTLYKAQLFSFLTAVLKHRPDLRFHILTNGQHFTPEDSDALRDLPEDNVLWGISVQTALRDSWS